MLHITFWVVDLETAVRPFSLFKDFLSVALCLSFEETKLLWSLSPGAAEPLLLG